MGLPYDAERVEQLRRMRGTLAAKRSSRARAKLDEVLHALGDARNKLTRIDEKEPEEIERGREHIRKGD